MPSNGRVVLLIIDGYGFDPEVEKQILDDVWERLSDARRDRIASGAGRDRHQALSPTPVTLRSRDEPTSTPGRPSEEAASDETVQALLREAARRRHYAVWAARTPFLFSARRRYPTAVTKTSGLAIGYEDLDPEVQGNSETGHQQIGSLVVDPQAPLRISLAIEAGTFFDNDAFEWVRRRLDERGGRLAIPFLLSGEYGDDGRVHSCWNHLEAFLDLCFRRWRLAPDRVRIEAILDGRDSPPRASVEGEAGRHRFLPKLRSLLERHGAVDSLAWIIGRSIAMDRDYDEEKTRADYRLLTRGEGAQVEGFQAAIEAVGKYHAEGYTDTTIPPIAVRDGAGEIRTLETGDVVVDMNFRADRQRAKIAATLGAVDFLQREAAARGSRWSLDWLDAERSVEVCCLTEYHPDFQEHYGARVAFPTAPNPYAFLPLTTRAAADLGRRFRYLLLAESNKAMHVGYFVRGRREEPEDPAAEQRVIVPSYGPEADVVTDDDFYKTPQMKAFQLAGVLANEAYRRAFDLAIVNLSNPDMLGHLIQRHFEEGVEALEVIDSILSWLVPLLRTRGYTVILTSDHGNIDDFSPAHGAHDVLTTTLPATGAAGLRLRSMERKVRLSDLSWTILDLLGFTDAVKERMPPVTDRIRASGFLGRSFLEPEDAG